MTSFLLQLRMWTLTLFAIAFCIAEGASPLSGEFLNERIPKIVVDDWMVADLRLIANGSFAPLEGFMNEGDYHSVLNKSHLENGSLFPIPIVLPVSAESVQAISETRKVLLQDDKSNFLALCEVEEIYEPDLEKECFGTLGTADTNHPFVKRILNREGMKYVGGKIVPFPALSELDRQEGIMTPAESREFFQDEAKVVAFQTRNPLHKAHVALIEHCLNQAGPDATLFLQPVVGPTQAEDVAPHIRRKCYEAILPYLGHRKVKLAYLPLAMRMAGPKEALLHAIIRKNHGATHFIVGRDHAGPSAKTQEGKSFYHPFGALELARSHAEELGLEILTGGEMVYVQERETFIPEGELKSHEIALRLSGTEIRRRLQAGDDLPDWFSYPDVVSILKSYYQSHSGLCVYFIGLSGAGKSTVANALKIKLEELDPLQRSVIMLDGDAIRRSLSSGLGFSKNDRSLHVQRLGYVANLIVQSGGICIVANIAPYEEDRQINRRLIQSKGVYFEVFVDTPLEVCESRDVKGLYALARLGKIPAFTGISDPFEVPTHSDLVLNGDLDINLCLQKILDQLTVRYPLIAETL